VKRETAAAAMATAVRRSRDFVWGWVMVSSLSAGSGGLGRAVSGKSFIFRVLQRILHVWREV
jgi:hypothetical protein